MRSSEDALDFTEELRLRRWAREHYVPSSQRSSDWPQVVLDEMSAKDRELAQQQSHQPRSADIVPLPDTIQFRFDPPHPSVRPSGASSPETSDTELYYS